MTDVATEMIRPMDRLGEALAAREVAHRRLTTLQSLGLVSTDRLVTALSARLTTAELSAVAADLELGLRRT